MELDIARERLIDYIIPVVAYVCKECEVEFYYEDDTARFCPRCGGKKIEVLYEWDVELLDWGWRR